MLILLTPDYLWSLVLGVLIGFKFLNKLSKVSFISIKSEAYIL